MGLLLNQHAEVVAEDFAQNLIDHRRVVAGIQNKSWPTLLKSNTFFTKIEAYLSGIHAGGK